MSAFWSKAVEAGNAARLLVEAGSYDGAVNRAYYAMFNAARAALDTRTELDLDDVRRHSAVLQLFSLHLVKSGLLPAKLSADIHEAFQARAMADYATASVPAQDARELVQLMDEMLQAIEPIVTM